ncbi:Clavaminate synthase-like protein, partial [Eremomyces bilateralis CBS 781.70]
SPSDTIQVCGPAVLSALPIAPEAVTRLAHAKLHAFRFDQVPEGWRRAYVEGLLWEVKKLVGNAIKNGESGAEVEGWLNEIITKLDRGRIIAGACGREELVRGVMERLEASFAMDGARSNEPSDHAAKRRKLTSPSSSLQPLNSSPNPPLSFSPTQIPGPPIHKPIPHSIDMDFMSFQSHLDRHGSPLIISNHISHWPAFSDPNRRWGDPRYWWKRTIGGRRLVPVEIGKSYTEEGWGQKLVPFGEFMGRLMGEAGMQGVGEDEAQVWYLAQHDLLNQIPALRNDIAVPDFCYCTPPSPPHYRQEPPSDPMLNMWLGPANTISPLHTDPHHNILCQVVGSKYVRLYSPGHSQALYPRGLGEDGVNMDNTSRVDLDEFIELFERQNEDTADEARREFRGKYPGFPGTPYVEGIIEEGDCLYIPQGWWHYVQSLSVSASVSFWWD